VKTLNVHVGRKKQQHSMQSPQHSNPFYAAPSLEDEEAEDGELEAGELCEDGDSANNFKRARHAIV